ncbi:MAG: hypothetical protein AB7G35_01940 [Hyphomicrobiaceae bacterium]
MARRKKASNNFIRFTVKVEAASLRVGRTGPGIFTSAPEGEADSYIHVEGLTDQPVMRDLRRVVILVSHEQEDRGDPGGAIDANEVWRVAVSLPSPYFDHLLSLVLSDKLHKASIGVENLSRGRGRVRTIDFSSAPVPSHREMEE